MRTFSLELGTTKRMMSQLPSTRAGCALGATEVENAGSLAGWMLSWNPGAAPSPCCHPSAVHLTGPDLHLPFLDAGQLVLFSFHFILDFPKKQCVSPLLSNDFMIKVMFSSVSLCSKLLLPVNNNA